MRVSILLARSFSLFVVLIAGTVGCAQPGTGVPGPSAASSYLSVGPSATAAGPSADYDASGPWCLANTDAHGNLDGSPWTTNIIQDPNTGNLSLTDEDGFPVTLERLSNGAGAIITYRVNFIGDEDGCDIRVMGTGRLDTTANTFTMPIRLKGLTCKGRIGAGVIGTKGSCHA